MVDRKFGFGPQQDEGVARRKAEVAKSEHDRIRKEVEEYVKVSPPVCTDSSSGSRKQQEG